MENTKNVPASLNFAVFRGVLVKNGRFDPRWHFETLVFNQQPNKANQCVWLISSKMPWRDD